MERRVVGEKVRCQRVKWSDNIKIWSGYDLVGYTVKIKDREYCMSITTNLHSRTGTAC